MADLKEDMLNKEQLDALSQLTDSIDKGLEIIAEKHGYNLRMTKARMEGPGFYAGQAGGKNKNKKRRMRGGAGICDGWKVSLAIDAFIIALAAGTGLGVLNFYLTTFGLDVSLGKIFSALYDIYQSGNVMTTTGHLASAAASGTYGIFSSGTTAALKAPGILMSLLKPISLLGLPVAGGRYLSTGISATEDLQKTLEVINSKISSMKEYSGAVTRSMRSKLETLQQKAQSLQREINERVGKPIVSKHNYLKETICGVLDKIIGGVSDPLGFGDLAEESLKELLAEEAQTQGFNPSEANAEIAQAQQDIAAGAAAAGSDDGVATSAGSDDGVAAGDKELVLSVPARRKRRRGGKRTKTNKGKKYTKTNKTSRKVKKYTKTNKTSRKVKKQQKKTRKH
jgi:hypothetical protein